MRKRNVHIQFWLDKKEADVFQKKVKKSGLSREAYLRHLVNGLEPQDCRKVDKTNKKITEAVILPRPMK